MTHLYWQAGTSPPTCPACRVRRAGSRTTRDARAAERELTLCIDTFQNRVGQPPCAVSEAPHQLGPFSALPARAGQPYPPTHAARVTGDAVSWLPNKAPRQRQHCCAAWMGDEVLACSFVRARHENEDWASFQNGKEERGLTPSTPRPSDPLLAVSPRRPRRSSPECCIALVGSAKGRTYCT